MTEQAEPENRILVCVVEKESGKGQCLRGEGERCVLWLKSEVDAGGLKPKIWINRTRCLGYCEATGTSVVVYSKANSQYSGVTLEDVKKIFGKLKEEIC